MMLFKLLNKCIRKIRFKCFILSGEMEQISKLFNENKINTLIFKRTSSWLKIFMAMFHSEHQVIWIFLFLFIDLDKAEELLLKSRICRKMSIFKLF